VGVAGLMVDAPKAHKPSRRRQSEQYSIAGCCSGTGVARGVLSRRELTRDKAEVGVSWRCPMAVADALRGVAGADGATDPERENVGVPERDGVLAIVGSGIGGAMDQPKNAIRMAEMFGSADAGLGPSPDGAKRSGGSKENI
jgi:hypothetical protein